jgi:histidine triad (HIT) family protein
MATLFTRIVNGEIPCYKIAENNNCLAFLDINPLAEGHTLVIPKKEVDYIFDLDDELYTDLQLFAKKIAKAIDKTVECSKVGVAVIGLEVPHAHIHLVPIKNIGDLNFANPKLKFSPDEFRAIAARIASYL